MCEEKEADASAAAAASGKIYGFQCAPDTTMLFYRKHEGKWQWNPTNPEIKQSSTLMSLPNNGWRSTDDSNMNGVALENIFLIRLLNDFNPGDHDGTAPIGSHPNRADAKEDLRMCSARLKHTPSQACNCKKSKCLRDLVGRYFKYIQVAENGVTERFEFAGGRLVLLQMEGWADSWLVESITVGLDILGVIDPFGLVADLLNAGISAIQGDIIQAVLSVAASIPAVGTLLLPMKWVQKSLKIPGISKATKWIKKGIDAFER